MKLSYRMLLFLADGEVHKLGEFLPHLLANIDPQIATRRYIRKGGKEVEQKRAQADLNIMLAIGKHDVFNETFWHLKKHGLIDCDDDAKDVSVWLTPKGKEAIRKPPRSGSIFQGLRSLWESGKVEISIRLVEPSNGDGE